MSDLAARVLKERQVTLDRLAVLDRGSRLGDRGVLDADNTPLTDPVDEAREALARLELLSGREVLVGRLKTLARAREKVREGTYGRCDQCGEPVLPARLRAMPEAIYCVPCASELEERRSRAARREGRIARNLETAAGALVDTE
jgi:RNA polymerase-binding transcription factor DksA